MLQYYSLIQSFNIDFIIHRYTDIYYHYSITVSENTSLLLIIIIIALLIIKKLINRCDHNNY